MGMQDRDYYREDYAQKNGMVYDSKKSIYYYPKMFRRSAQAEAQGVRPSPRPWHPVLQIVLTCAIMLAVFLLLKVIARFH